MDSTIINLTYDKKVYFLHAIGATAPYIEYEVYDEDGALYAEGQELSTNYYVQVDIFSTGSYSALEDAIRAKMLGAGFIRSSSADLYEQDTGLFHKAMRFIYTSTTL